MSAEKLSAGNANAPKNHKAGLVCPAFFRGTGSVNLVSIADPECRILYWDAYS